MDLVILLDDSGSMSQGGKADEACTALNGLLSDQRKVPGELNVSLFLFSAPGLRKCVYRRVPLAQVQNLSRDTYRAQGPSTALLDAIVETVKDIGLDFKVSPPEGVIFAILTDGLENASRTYSQEYVQRILKEHEERWKWDIRYLGAGPEAFSQYHTLGINAYSALRGITNDASGIAFAGASLSSAVTSYRSTGKQADWSDDQNPN